MITERDRVAAQALMSQQAKLEQELTVVTSQLRDIRDRCDHPNLPKREVGEQYMDACPDCGHIAYCYAL